MKLIVFRLGEAMFSRDEVEAILERVTSSVQVNTPNMLSRHFHEYIQDTANAELKRIVNMSALVLEDIFRHADSAITLNLTGTEDEGEHFIHWYISAFSAHSIAGSDRDDEVQHSTGCEGHEGPPDQVGTFTRPQLDQRHSRAGLHPRRAPAPY